MDPNANHDVQIITIAVVFSLFATLALVGRLVSKKMKKVGPSSDDVILIAAYVCRIVLRFCWWEIDMCLGGSFGGDGSDCLGLVPTELCPCYKY